MKKVSIITIIDNNNFGTFLQAFALCKKVEQIGAKPELVDYCRPHMSWRHKAGLVLKTIHNPLRLLSRLLTLWKSYKTHQNDRKFIQQYLSPCLCKNIDEIKHSVSADIYMTGSDQVWNSIHNEGLDTVFYLNYASGNVPRVAYAASIGMPDFQDWEKEKTKALLERYTIITLREQSSIELLAKLGINRSKLHTVLDPTLLLDKEEWKKQIKIPRLHEEKYLLVYSVETKKQNSVIENVAEKIAKKRNLKIVGIYYGGIYGQMQCCDYNHHYATPDVFLSLMYYADYVVVSSFHGTAFSLNFNKEFITVMPNRFNSRVLSLLTTVNATDRIIKNANSDLASIRPLDYSKINNILEREREKSVSLLKQMVNVDNKAQNS